MKPNNKQEVASTSASEQTEGTVPTLQQGLWAYEFLDSKELGRRLNLPESWIRDQVRARATDPLPFVHFGKYVRFAWGSPELQAWLSRRIFMGNNKRVGRVH